MLETSETKGSLIEHGELRLSCSTHGFNASASQSLGIILYVATKITQNVSAINLRLLLWSALYVTFTSVTFAAETVHRIGLLLLQGMKS